MPVILNKNKKMKTIEFRRRTYLTEKGILPFYFEVLVHYYYTIPLLAISNARAAWFEV